MTDKKLLERPTKPNLGDELLGVSKRMKLSGAASFLLKIVFKHPDVLQKAFV